MARIKQAITQRDFTRMEVREDFLERDDLDIRRQSVRSGKNMRALATGASEARPGLAYMRETPTAYDAVEISPTADLKFGLLINDDSLEILTEEASVVHSELSVPWTDGSQVWVAPFRERTLIGGSFGIYDLEYDEGTWTFTPTTFAEAPGGEIAQPYWAYEQGITLRPSARFGSITVTSSEPFWTDDYVGLRIRYGQREILITARVSSTVVQGTVINELPPTFRITLASNAGFRIGDAVVGADSNYQGVIVNAFGGNQIDVLTLSVFEGPTNTEKLASPTTSSTVSGKSALAPTATAIWDEPLMSDVRGWPRAGTAVSGRLVLVDFAAIPDLVALSSVRALMDFESGLEDDDAIVRQVGDNAPRWLHAVNASDLILLSDKGCYYVPTSDNGLVTPSNFQTILFDQRSASPVRPVQVDDGVVFVESSGEHIAAAFQEGNIYLKWSARTISTLYAHLIKTPIKLCGPALSSEHPEKYVLVINQDGTIAAASWETEISDIGIGMAPWETNGAFVSASPVFGEYFALVDRTPPGGTKRRFLERFDTTLVVDSAIVALTDPNVTAITDADGAAITDADGNEVTAAIPLSTHLAGFDVEYATAQWNEGPFMVQADGSISSGLTPAEPFQVGLNFEARVKPWSVELIESDRIGLLKARTIRCSISVQNTAKFQYISNGKIRTAGGYRSGDNLALPPPLRTEVFRFPVMGRRDHPEIEFVKNRPGAFRVLAITQEVQG